MQTSAKPPLKIISAAEVAQHNTKDKRVWVTYKEGVYDVTDWVDQHPGGGARIMLAAGGALDPFWAMYAQHQTQQVKNLLEGYRIGNLEGGSTNKQVEDPYANEPSRHPALRIASQKPFNAETPNDVLATAMHTPNELFYVRNHLPTPHVDSANYSLRVEGEGLRTVELSLQDLKTKFKKHSLSATLQCSGNRRHELSAVRPIKGLDWSIGAIGNAEWAGVRLRDVLEYAGFDERTANEVEHVQFEGLDSDVSGTCYGASIPVEKAAGPFGDVLLAYEMNGRTLPFDHGFPLRVVVPGITGARSVKWLSRIIASKDESQSHWQQSDYKSFSPSVDWDNVDWNSAPAIQETPVTSAICEPKPGEKVDAGHEVPVRGYAFSGGGHAIVRVDVSADGGKTWQTAELIKEGGKRNRAWAWTLWKAEVLIPQSGTIQLVSRAVDAAYNTQPDNTEPLWNLRGVVNNAWHRVDVTAE
eukprot:jgi/Astpho2/6279/e_gw1.00088.31.1_t